MGAMQRAESRLGVKQGVRHEASKENGKALALCNGGSGRGSKGIWLGWLPPCIVVVVVGVPVYRCIGVVFSSSSTTYDMIVG